MTLAGIPTLDDIKRRYTNSILKTQKLYEDRRNKDTAGGVRTEKGDVVEQITKDLVRIAWSKISNNQNRLTMDRKKVKIGFGDSSDVYKLSQDVNVYIDNAFKISIECKSYTEVAMYKRILTDALLLKKRVPSIKFFFVVQLENFMGGDYGNKIEPTGSSSVRVLNHFFPDVRIDVLTLLDGDREINKPIHKPENFKPLKDERLNYAIKKFTEALKD